MDQKKKSEIENPFYPVISVDPRLSTVLFMILSLTGQVAFDWLGNQIVDVRVSLIFAIVAFGFLYPAIKKISWAPSLTIAYWGTANFISTLIWGFSYGFRYQGVVIAAAAIILNLDNRDPRLFYAICLQGIYFIGTEILGSVGWLGSGVAPHPYLTQFNYYLATVYLIWVSMSSVRQIQINQKTIDENRKLLESVLQTLPIAVFGKDIKSNFKWNIWNNGAEDLFGLKAKDCLGKTDYDFFPKEQADFFRQKDIEASQTTEIINIPEENAIGKNGPVILKTRKSVIRDGNGNPSILLGITENITENKAREMQILERQGQLELIADSVPGPVSRVDGQGRYVFANKIYEDWFGLKRQDILGKTHQEILPPDIYQLAEPNIKKGLAGERVVYQGNTILKDGTKRFFQTIFVPYVNPSGQKDGFFTIVFDITSLKETEQRLLHTSKLASLGEMSAGIAHEINNPLAIIEGMVDLLSVSKDDAQKFDHKITSIKASCARIAKIVRGLKKFSRSGEKTVLQPLPLKDIAIESLSLLEAKSKKFDTPINLNCETTSEIYCDQIEIEQVFVNFVGNAIDAVKSLPEKWVKVSIFDKDKFVILRIEDSGPGIPEKIREKLFLPFFTTKPVGEGTGLGLSISKGILDEHHATVRIDESSPNTCFEICFEKVKSSKSVA